MSFRCSKCGQDQPAGVRPNIVPLKVRYVGYNSTKNAPIVQIAKEGKICDRCDATHRPEVIEGQEWLNAPEQPKKTTTTDAEEYKNRHPSFGRPRSLSWYEL
jgi:hypothetical protein